MVFPDGLRNVSVLGNRDFRLPGLGSFLQTAASAGDTARDRLGPGRHDRRHRADRSADLAAAIAWSDKFKFEQVESNASPASRVLNLLRRSPLLSRLRETVLTPLSERVYRRQAHAMSPKPPNQPKQPAGSPSMAEYMLVAAAPGPHCLGPVRRFENPARAHPGGSSAHREKRGRHVPACRGVAHHRFRLGHSGGCRHRLSPAFGAHRAAARADRRVGPRHRIIPCDPARSHQPRRRPGRRLDSAHAPRHPVVHPLQRNRRSHRDSHPTCARLPICFASAPCSAGAP